MAVDRERDCEREQEIWNERRRGREEVDGSLSE
jgi:hypothetical protein